LSSAKEVVGPPGTGKTMTITEVVRGIIECSDFDVIVLSERNGAIDAIAQKIAGDCLSRIGDSPMYKVKDMRLWTKLLAYGSYDGMGTSTQLFTVPGKLR
jgi:Cdc6-like AAA superfamily ATPase